MTNAEPSLTTATFEGGCNGYLNLRRKRQRRPTAIAVLEQLENAIREYGIRAVLRAIASVCDSLGREREKQGEPITALQWSLISAKLTDVAAKIEALR